jgi:MoaA/NifB/PqqE/SkfB family radical SAM enzyme
MSKYEEKSVISGLVNLELTRREDFARNLFSNACCEKPVDGCSCENEVNPSCSLHQPIIDRYVNYRENWRAKPKEAFVEGEEYRGYSQIQPSPLCLDIEIAAVCDLACPFCFRQSIITPDKLMKFDDYVRIIEQASELNIPSIKLNWRGEPLLHPQIDKMIRIAKSLGILEVIINTNATQLDRATSIKLINAGLDRMIYSFDGGSKRTYEKMRPGRFKTNSFEDVLKNIYAFSEIRDELGAFWPRTQIQMIVTEETKNEQQDFIDLFKDKVDYVSVKPYTERGGSLTEVSAETRNRVEEAKLKLNLKGEVEIRWDIEGNLFLATGRVPCEQPFQRLMITYDGVVSMCCYDWGSSYPVGYVLDRSFSGSNDVIQVERAVESGKRGFELMKNARRTVSQNVIPLKVESLKEIWTGKEIERVRKAQVRNRAKDISICAGCKFKETYSWQPIGFEGQNEA